MDAFDTAMSAHEKDAGSASPETNNQDLNSGSPQVSENVQSKDQAILDLEKTEKFSFGGREWTRDGLKALIDQEKKFQSMDKDYTTKMQTMSAERKAFEEKQPFYKALHWDLPKLVKDPSLVQEFIKKYPPEFHQIAADYLRENQPQTNDQEQRSPNQPQVDVTLLSRLDQLEKTNHQREVKVNEQEIENIRHELNAKYPNVNRPAVQKMILAEAFEQFEKSRSENPGFQFSREDWENIYKSTSDEIANISKAEYGELVKKQTEANSKAKDVGAGGGVVGSAPVKFKKFDDLAKHAEALSRGG